MTKLSAMSSRNVSANVPPPSALRMLPSGLVKMFSVRVRRSPSLPSLKKSPLEGESAAPPPPTPGPLLSNPAEALSSRPDVMSSSTASGPPFVPPSPRRSTPKSRRKRSLTLRKRDSIVMTIPVNSRRSSRKSATWACTPGGA